MDNLHRDELTMPIVGAALQRGSTGTSPPRRESSSRGRAARGRRRDAARAAIGHALAFTTWHSLAREQGLDDAQAVELMRGLVAASAEHRR